MPERYTYIGKLFVFSTSLHVIFFGIIFFSLNFNQSSKINIVLKRKHSAKIVLLPLIKSVPGAIAKLSTQTKPPFSSLKIAQAKPPVKSNPKKIVPKKVEPPKKNTTIVAAQKPKPAAKQLVAKQLIAKPLPKPVPKKVPQKVQPPKPKPIKQEKKVEPSKKIEQKDQPLKNIAERLNQEEIIYLGRDDVVTIELHSLMQEEIEKTWQPPLGLSKDLVCKIKVQVDTKGQVGTVMLQESSAVISYDIAARMALNSCSYPKAFWGKEVVITFKQ